MPVLVTRPQPQADDWVARLQAAGLQAAALPLLHITLGGDAGALQAAWQQLPQCRLAMFVSANAVAGFFLQRAAAPWPASTLAGSTGPGTTQALLRAGVPAACIREPAPDSPQLDSEALWQVLQHEPWNGAQVLVVRGDGGRDWLADTLRRHGARVSFVPAYARGLPTWTAGQQALAQAARQHPQQHVWLFSSSEGLRQLAQLAPGADWSAAPALATHPRIAAAAREAGFVQVQPVAPGFSSVLAALRDQPGAHTR
jgi:uroporphyrinogen-III synthase